MDPLDGCKLRVCAYYLNQERNKKYFQNSRIIILGHILPTTEVLINLLQKAGADIFCIVAKPYSISNDVLSRLKELYSNIIEKSYDDLEETDILDKLLSEAYEKSIADNRKILVIDVGGYFANPFVKLDERKLSVFAGIIEDTTFGHKRYLEAITKIKVPVISVARSRLKEIEAHYVGKDGVQALDLILREQGISITGHQALVIGYGMIGKNVARCLNAADLSVSVYDIRDHRNLKAYMMGYKVNKKIELLHTADIVFAATGWSANQQTELREPALSLDEILEKVKDNTILISLGSKDNEFDIRGLKELATSRKNIGDYIDHYVLPTGNNIYVIKDGTAANFILPSIPVEILDLVFSEIVLSCSLLLKNPTSYPIGKVHQLDEKYWSFIAKDWLRFVNH